MRNRLIYKILVKVFLAIILCVLLVFINNVINQSSNKAFQNGEANITIINENQLFHLKGEWEFFWQKHYHYDDLKAGVSSGIFVYAPSAWSSYIINGEKLSNVGYGTYKLKVKGIPKETDLSIRVAYQTTCYSLYIDDKLLLSSGTAGVTDYNIKLEVYSAKSDFKTTNDEFYIIIHISNFICNKGGMSSPVTLGTVNGVTRLHNNIIYKDLVILGVLLIVGFFYLLTFLKNKKPVYIYFFCLSFLSMLRVLLYGNQFIAVFFNFLDYSSIMRLDYLSIYFYPLLFLQVFKSLFPNVFKGLFYTIFNIFLIIFSIVLTLITILTKPIFFTGLLLIIQIVIIVSILYFFLNMIKSIIRKEKNAILFVIGLSIIVGCLIHDVLFYNNIIDYSLGEIAALGIFIFICIQIYITANNYSNALKDSDNLFVSLNKEKELTQKVMQTEAAFLQAQIKPHFLFNVLNTIDACCEQNPKKMSDLVCSLSNYLRKSFDFENNEKMVSINKELSFINAYLTIEKTRFDYLNVEYDIDYTEEFFLPPFILQPLVENAVKHGISNIKERLDVKITIKEKVANIYIAVQDNGIGMCSETIETLLNPNCNKGVALKNINSRLMYFFNTKLCILSEEGKGTTVSFIIPKVKKDECNNC